MRLLVIHNFYGSSAPSGENIAVLEEMQLLRSAGHEVETHFVSSDTVRGRGIRALLKTAVLVPWRNHSQGGLPEQLARFEPDIVHVHNVFPLLSPSVFWELAKYPAAIVYTLHNYRIICPKPEPYRNAQPCLECIESRTVMPAIVHGCYRNSRLASIPSAISVCLHWKIGTYIKKVDAFIVFSRFQKLLFAERGLPADKVHVKPNCLLSLPKTIPWKSRSGKTLFVGRIGREKGLDTLLEAWSMVTELPTMLEVIGGGPELAGLVNKYGALLGGRVRFLGEQSPEKTRALIQGASLLVMPSLWFEGFPLVLREALAYGVPVIASDIGVFKEVLDNRVADVLFAPGDPNALAGLLRKLWNNPRLLEELSEQNRRKCEDEYSPQENTKKLLDVYGAAIRASKHRRCEVS